MFTLHRILNYICIFVMTKELTPLTEVYKTMIKHRSLLVQNNDTEGRITFVNSLLMPFGCFRIKYLMQRIILYLKHQMFFFFHKMLSRNNLTRALEPNRNYIYNLLLKRPISNNAENNKPLSALVCLFTQIQAHQYKYANMNNPCKQRKLDLPWRYVNRSISLSVQIQQLVRNNEVMAMCSRLHNKGNLMHPISLH